MQIIHLRAVPDEIVLEALTRLDTERSMLRNAELAKSGEGPYAGVDRDLLDLVPSIALAVTAPARDRLAAEVAEAGGPGPRAEGDQP